MEPVLSVRYNVQVKVVEETIRYIDQLHRLLAKRVIETEESTAS